MPRPALLTGLLHVAAVSALKPALRHSLHVAEDTFTKQGAKAEALAKTLSSACNKDPKSVDSTLKIGAGDNAPSITVRLHCGVTTADPRFVATRQAVSFLASVAVIDAIRLHMERSCPW